MAGKRIAVFSLLALVGLALALFASSGTHAQSYNPTFGYTVAIPTGGTVSDTTNVIAIPSPDYNYEDSSLYTFTPIDWWLATGDVIPIADEVGTLSAAVAVGLLGGPCSTNLPPSFTLENASVDASDELGPTDMYWVLKDAITHPVPYAKHDPNIPDYLEAMPHFINEMLDPDGAAGSKPPLQARARYAGYTTVAGMNIIIQFIVLNPGQLTEMGGIKTQMVREWGHPSLVVLDNPVSQEEAPGAISDFCTPLTTTTTLLGTTTPNQYTGTGGGIVARTNPPTDTGVLGTGTHMARNYSQSERDADGDGHENDLDPCFYTADAGWDPRAAVAAQPGLDTDGDGLGDSCDPDITGTTADPDLIDCDWPRSTQGDCDGDGYNNRQDNCPLVPNGCTVASCSPEFDPIYNAAWDNQADDDGFEPNADLGPGPDSIGNSCDDSDCDGVEDGAVTPCSCADGIDNGTVGGPDNLIDGNDPDCQPSMDQGELLAATDPWGAQPGTGQFYHAMPWTAVTMTNDAGTVDTDGDGYSDSLEALLGSCADDTPTCETQGFLAGTDPEDSMPESLVIDVKTLTVGAGSPPRSGGFPALDVPQSCSDGVDNDLDGKTDAADNDALGCDKTIYTSDENTLIPATHCPGDANCCDNATDDDKDGYVNDGCPQVGTHTEAPAGCENSVSDDTPSPDVTENALPGAPWVNDGCPQVNDSDYDGHPNPDNCPAVKNPEQTDTDGDGTGDACDDDDDDDGFDDDKEWSIGTDPLDDCPSVSGKHDAWPLDQNIDKSVTVVGDVLKYAGNVGASVGGSPPTSWALRRLDLNADGSITVVGDVLKYAGKIGSSCT